MAPVCRCGTIGPSDWGLRRAAAQPEMVPGPVEAVPAVGAEEGAEDGEGDDEAEHVQHGLLPWDRSGGVPARGDRGSRGLRSHRRTYSLTQSNIQVQRGFL
ncbi:hypothetical protein GCM10023088_35200 [Actinomadura verrucosospora]